MRIYESLSGYWYKCKDGVLYTCFPNPRLDKEEMQKWQIHHGTSLIVELFKLIEEDKNSSNLKHLTVAEVYENGPNS